MDVREKLVELLDEAEEWADHKCDELDCETCHAGKMKGNCVQQLMVGRLIDNGVTVQEWISVKDRLPKPFTPVIVYRKSFGTLPPYIKVDKMILWNDDAQIWTDEVGNWKNVTTHWMPLPQPPKGE